MSTLHVAITGRDKHHLAALGPKLRVVVVGYREEKHRFVVDAYIHADKVAWLKRQGYGVTRLEEVDAHDRARQAEGHAAATRRLKKGRYGDVIWGGPDILIYFAMRLLRAYRDREGFRLGKKRVSPALVRRLVETMDIVVLPQVNPDGRAFSMDRHPFWRKNRRPAPRGQGFRSIGVDLNRNFPFLWRFDRHFAQGTVESTHKPGDYETYVGPRPASEPETRNVMWLLDRFPNIRYYVDLHSYGETILHSWGSDDDQSKDPRMNFRNTTYDGTRGRILDDVYREYIPAADKNDAVQMSRPMAGAIRLVRGRESKVKQSVGLYPTAGASDDYAYSRHWVDPKKGRLIAFTIEWGRSHASTPFHPPYPELRKVMREVSAGLLALCLRALAKRTNGSRA